MGIPRLLLLVMAISMAWTLACAGPLQMQGKGLVRTSDGRLLRRAPATSASTTDDNDAASTTAGVVNPKFSASAEVATTSSSSSSSSTVLQTTTSSVLQTTTSSVLQTTTSPTRSKTAARANSTYIPPFSSSPSSSSSTPSSSSTASPASTAAASTSSASLFNPSNKLFPVTVVVLVVLVLVLLLLLIGLGKRIAHHPRFRDSRDYFTGLPIMKEMRRERDLSQDSLDEKKDDWEGGKYGDGSVEEEEQKSNVDDWRSDLPPRHRRVVSDTSRPLLNAVKEEDEEPEQHNLEGDDAEEDLLHLPRLPSRAAGQLPPTPTSSLSYLQGRRQRQFQPSLRASTGSIPNEFGALTGGEQYGNAFSHNTTPVTHGRHHSTSAIPSSNTAVLHHSLPSSYPSSLPPPSLRSASMPSRSGPPSFTFPNTPSHPNFVPLPPIPAVHPSSVVPGAQPHLSQSLPSSRGRTSISEAPRYPTVGVRSHAVYRAAPHAPQSGGFPDGEFARAMY
ncbi:hypothetical protein T439DRAFT_354748 [Meredithblackwellia eburnea MCA 4105]